MAKVIIGGQMFSLVDLPATLGHLAGAQVSAEASPDSLDLSPVLLGETEENLRDHTATRLTFECRQPITINDIARSPWLKVKEGLRFAEKPEDSSVEVTITSASITTGNECSALRDFLATPEFQSSF